MGKMKWCILFCATLYVPVFTHAFYEASYRRLNGGSSPVLTATIWPNQHQNPWSDWDKIWHSWLRPWDDALCQILCKSICGRGASRQMGEI